MEKIQFKCESLVEILEWRAENQPDKPAFIFLEDGERESSVFSYKMLDIRAKAIASYLQSSFRNSLHGQRALLIYESGPDYIDSFFGCLYTGIISVPLHPPGKNKLLSRIAAIAKDSGAKIILSTEEIKNELETEFSNDEVLKNLDWVSTDKISNNFTDNFKPTKIKPETLAYLQYTSGSTGTPKGVMVNHRNLIHNINIIDKSHPHTDESVMVTWLPIHHDMGLIYGILLPFVCGYPCYYMTPQAFVQKPFRWLYAISKYKGTHNAAPNFAFELCVNKIFPEQKKLLDLSSWAVAMNAAEPVRAETIERFVDYFKECGFRLKYFSPGYGLAEGTLILSTTLKDDEPVMKRFDDSEIEKNNRAIDAKENDLTSKVHVGHSNSIEDTRIAIVNPVTLIECKDGEVGEVWASGISIAQGYWQREEATKETFKAHIADTNEGPFLRTGDLGFIKNNELYITGRYKDLIIIRGQNHYPQDIEYTVEASHPALRLGCVAAFPVEAEGEEHIGIVQEVQKNFVNDFDADEVFKAIRKSVSEEHNLQVYSITLIHPGTVPKTSSGKIQRNACRRGVEEGSLSVIASWKIGETADNRSQASKKKDNGKLKFNATKNNLQDWFINRLSELMQIKKDSIDPNEPFASYGMDSLKAVQISGDLEELLEKELPSSLVYDYPTITILAKYLSDDTAETPDLKKTEAKGKIDNEPIAIVGIGLRFPDANNVNEFWNNLINGKDSIKKIPDERWNKEQLKNSTITLGGFVDDVDKFDPVFFGISPREAIQIDPQQRFTLEVAWQALEDAGINPETLAGTNTGVFMGICTYDYSRFSSGKKELFDVYTGTGTSLSIAANRLSYYFDFRGPSIAIDTACSSSLVALHAACQSLRNGESTAALAGGVNLLLSPDWNVVFTEADMLAPDGRCKTFDEAADGYVRSEGCGIIVLKKLSDAELNGDRIYSVIRGSAINQDGRSNGLTAPNGPSQEEVIKSALRNAEVKSNEISYLETHGTGTPLGDPIEVNSLTRVITEGRSEENICYIGSVKTNIGHLEAAAGIAGVIKAALSLYNNEIPRHLHYKNLNPEIQISGKPIKVADKNIKWNGKNKIAGVSSFGFGGTNAHIILAEAPAVLNSNSKTEPYNIFTLSAKNENVLKKYADDYVNFLDTNKNIRLEDICYTVNEGRASHNIRLAIVCKSADDLKNELEKFSKGKNPQKIFSGQAKINYQPKIAFLFPGQGAQFIGMGKELYDANPLFRNIINKCDEILRKYLDKPLLEVLFYEKDEKLNPINETTYTQPALFAIEYALAKVWMSWGINPAVMMGHSAGEYVAACLAGVFSLEDGLKLVTERGRLMQTMTGEGEMYTVFAGESMVKKYIKGFENLVSIASINSPQKTVISGDKNTLAKIISEIDSDKIEFKKINVSIASHSPLMNSMIEEYRKVCGSIKYFSPEMPVVSNITGEIVTDKISNSDYWCEHILSTVRFSDGIKACEDFGCEFFIDLGPKPTSIQMGQETIQGKNIHWLPSIKYNFPIQETMLSAIAELFTCGSKIDWKNFYKDFFHKKISLPVYPFQRQRYWIDNEDNINRNKVSYFIQDDVSHPLLGNRLFTASSDEIIYNSQLSAARPEYLKDHIVFDKIILPGAAFAEIAIAGYHHIEKKDIAEISDLKFHKALDLEYEEVKSIQTIFKLIETSAYEFKIYSRQEENEWSLHASGILKKPDSAKSESNESGTLKSKFTDKMSTDNFYDTIKKTGVEYGKYFRGIERLYTSNDSALSEIVMDGNVSDAGYQLHPIILDSALQTSLVFLNRKNLNCAFIPVGIGKINFYHKPGKRITTYAEIVSSDAASGIYFINLKLFSEQGKIISQISDLRIKEVSRNEFITPSQDITDWFYEVDWEEAETDAGKSELHLKRYSDGIVKLNQLSIKFIIETFNKLGIDFTKGKRFDIQNPGKDFKVIEKYERLFYRFAEILLQNKIIKRSGNAFEVNTDLSRKAAREEINTIKNNFPEVESEMTLLERCGEKLNEVLTGKLDALELLFPSGDYSDAFKLYKDSPGFAAMNNRIREAVIKHLNIFDSDKQIKILEIGAGTGGTTQSVLSVLTGKNFLYTFTDISPAFFAKAKKKFVNPEIEFKILDIEKDPLSQGFVNNQFDIIIASNVIHATKDLNISIENMMGLLNDNGVIILNEATRKQSWIDVTFGLTDGWWRFEDEKLRSYPLLESKEWNAFLNKLKFQARVDENEQAGQATLKIFKGKKQEANDKSLIIFCGNSDRRELRKYLHTMHHKYILVYDDKKFERIGENEFSIRYSERKDFEKLFNSLAGISKRENIIYIASEDKDKAATGNCMNLVSIIQTVSGNISVKPESLTVITYNSQNADNDIFNLNQSSLRGLVKVISIEHPEMKPKYIDTDIETGWKIIFDEIIFEHNESEIAFRKNKKYVSRLKRFDFTKKKDLKIDGSGTYLITGGTGGLGILTAKWLAENGAKHIALTGRKGSAEKIKNHIKDLKARGVDIKVIKADVSDKDEMKKVITGISGAKNRIKGIFHSAGILDDAVILNQTVQKFEKVFSAKARGAWNLHELTKKLNLEIFAMYSSVASILGSAGQANHSAANSFLDSLAHYRRKNNLPAISINWGLWSEIGAAAEKGADKREKIAGLKNINPVQGVIALDKAMRLDTAEAGIFPIDWEQFGKANNGKFTERLIQKKEESKYESGEKIDKEDFVSRLINASEDKQTDILVEYFQNLISRIMGLDPEDFEPEQQLNTMGLDSLMAIELKNKVNIELGVDLNLVRYVEETNIIQLAQELKEQLPKLLNKKEHEDREGGKDESEDEKTRELISNLENLSDEELDKLLNQTE